MSASFDSESKIWSYDTIITQRGGRFYARIPELNLIAEGETAASAHEALEADRRRLVERHMALGVPLPLPRDVGLRREWRERVVPFAFKAAIVALAVASVFVTGVVTLNYALREPLRHSAQKAARAATQQITLGLEDFARRDLSPDREERLRAALRGVIPVLRPYFEELKPLFPDDPARARGNDSRG